MNDLPRNKFVMMRILIIEDDLRVVEPLHRGLQEMALNQHSRMTGFQAKKVSLDILLKLTELIAQNLTHHSEIKK